MVIYRGIQFVYAHVVQLIQSVGGWFSDIVWSDLTDMMPLNFQPLMTSLIVVILSIAAIGLVKKLSFMLG